MRFLRQLASRKLERSGTLDLLERALRPEYGPFPCRTGTDGTTPPRCDDRSGSIAAIMGDIERADSTEEPEDTAEPELPPRRFDAWRRRSAMGAIATGVALGLKEIFQPTNIEPVITAPVPGDPPDADQRLRVILDPDDPTKSVAILPSAPESAATPD
jgi:hypothetical protein